MTEDADDRKPQSDEARSAFTPPQGVPQSQSPENESQITSEFALPEGLAAPPAGEDAERSAFTPPATYDARSAPPPSRPRRAYRWCGWPRTVPGRTGCGR
ncbi:hypothetical protein ACFQVA_17660 [Actinomadura keratinilytica]